MSRGCAWDTSLPAVSWPTWQLLQLSGKWAPSSPSYLSPVCGGHQPWTCPWSVFPFAPSSFPSGTAFLHWGTLVPGSLQQCPVSPLSSLTPVPSAASHSADDSHTFVCSFLVPGAYLNCCQSLQLLIVESLTHRLVFEVLWNSPPLDSTVLLEVDLDYLS